MLAKCRDDPTHVHRGEFRKLRRDGGITWVRELARLVPSEYGTPLILLVCDDITERKEAEDQLRQHQEELAHMARVSTLGEMVSGIAHELNQPLSAIVNYAQGCARRLRAGEGNASTLAKAMEDIATQAHRGGEIIRHLRKMVRKGEKSERLVNVNELVRDVLRLNEGETRRSSTSVVLNLAADLPMVRCDPIQIEQVILNLMNNALEAMQCIDRANRWLGICSCIKEADCVEICIRDNGPGVRTDGGFEQMFAPFYTTKPHGMGMGLTISQSIAEAHGGKLAAQPRPEGGAAFCLTLPVCKPEPKQRF
jgi:C4-dicarboxylate-specific signal transduction histidine kinase